MADQSNKPSIRFAGFTDPWEQRKLGGIAQKVTAKNLDGRVNEVLTNSAEYGVIRQTEFFDHAVAKEDSITGYYVVEPGDFVYNPRVSVTAPVGPISRNKLGRSGVMSPLYTVFRLTGNTNGNYLGYFFKTDLWHGFMKLEGNSGARSDRFSIGDETFFEMPVPVPCADEQQAIGSFFSRLDSLITLHQRKYDKLVVFKKAMLEQMFPQEGETVPKIRFAGFTDPWEQRKLGEVVDQFKELVPTPQNGYVRMGVRSHAKGTFLTDVNPGAQIEEKELCRVAPNNLVVNIVFAWEHAVAITAENDAVALVSHRFPQFSFHEDMSPNFFRFIILDGRFRHHLWLASPSGAGRNKTLNVKSMLEYGFVVPHKEEQQKIGNFFSRLDDLITLHQRKLELLRNIKKSLLDEMFV
ncbi:restriction endonuclease subunit S [Bifidobacterium jacchi]|uniref:Restriction endonuclease subunit S n=1 Tax=Bifidobacterium jacchi TaxID=2490545 RepID=A0A5N5RDP9_9BIFI|nr:restriction endonuclease subunit S [Bifidobacterium jacchi]KAB5605398.1 restriction endonuclease subunit S [Bifidobacterium jacchi]